MKPINWKNILSWQNITAALVFAGSLYGFLNFESSWIVRIAVLILSCFAIIYLFWKNYFEFLILVIYFLALFDFYNLYFMIGLPLWAVMIFVFFVSAGIIYLYFAYKKNSIENKIALFYVVFFALIALEIFLSLIPWPADPKNKAMIILSVFYIFYNLILLKEKNEWELKKIYPYLIIMVVIIVLVVTTIKWYGY